MKNACHTIVNNLIFAGTIVLLIGAYYLVVKAGIPYQDPPLELQIKYAVNMGIGDELFIDGMIMIIIGAAGRAGLWWMGKGNRKGSDD